MVVIFVEEEFVVSTRPALISSINWIQLLIKTKLAGCVFDLFDD